MLIGFAKRGTGGGGSPVRYLTAETASAAPLRYLISGTAAAGRRRTPAPVIVRGDPTRTRAVIDSLKFKHKYTSGVLSFAPGETLAPDVEQRIMDEFERTAFAGLDRDRYEILWVRHRHTPTHRHELHFLIPRIELQTGKSLNIAPPRESTKMLFDTLRSKINAELGLADPDDPARARRHRVPSHLAKCRVLDRASAAGISSRAAPAKRPDPARARQLQRKLEDLIEARAAYHRQRYQTPAIEPLTEPGIPAQGVERHDRTRTPSAGRTPAPRSGFPGARPDICQYADRLEQTTQRWGRAYRDLDLAGERFGHAHRTLACDLDQALAAWERRKTTADLLQRYGVTLRPSVGVRDLDNGLEPEPEIDLERR